MIEDREERKKNDVQRLNRLSFEAKHMYEHEKQQVC